MTAEESTGGWRHGPAIPTAGASSVLRSADYALKRFRTIGVPIPSPCRLEAARAVVSSARNARDGADDFALLAEATRTVYEFYYISRSIGGTGGTADRRLKAALGNALSGPLDIREEEDESARPRNTQFELFVGAWLTCGGATIRQAEPDLQLQIDEKWLGVAAKRVRSRRKILQRVVEASEQGRHRTKAGLVALSIDHFIEPVDTGPDPKVAGQSLETHVPEILEAHELLMSQAHIRGFVVIGSKYEWVSTSAHGRPHLRMSTFSRFQLFANSDEEKLAGDAFLSAFDETQRDRLSRF